MAIETPTLVQDATWQLGVGYLDVRPFVLRAPGGSSAAVFRFTGLTRAQLLTGSLDDAGGPKTETGKPNTLRYRSATFTLGVFSWPADSLPATLELYGLRAPASAWSTPNAPALREQNASVNAPQLGASLDAGDTVLLASGLFSVSSSISFTLDLTALHALALAPDWDGTLNLWLVGLSFPVGASGATFKDSTLDGAGAAVVTLDVDTQDITGLKTDRNSWQGRARRCTRCGRPKVSDEFVRDGETRILVCEDCNDLRQVPRYVGRGARPPINEG